MVMVFSIAKRKDDEDAKIIEHLYILYGNEFKVIDIRKVLIVNTHDIGVKIGKMLKWAGFDVKMPVYLIIKDNSIVINQSGVGVKRKVVSPYKNTRLILGKLGEVLGLKEGDKVVVKVKHGQIIITPIWVEKGKIRRLKRDRENNNKFDYIIEDIDDI